MENLFPTAEGQPSKVQKMLEKLQILDNEVEQNQSLDRILNYLTSADNGKICFINKLFNCHHTLFNK